MWMIALVCIKVGGCSSLPVSWTDTVVQLRFHDHEACEFTLQHMEIPKELDAYPMCVSLEDINNAIRDKRK